MQTHFSRYSPSISIVLLLTVLVAGNGALAREGETIVPGKRPSRFGCDVNPQNCLPQTQGGGTGGVTSGGSPGGPAAGGGGSAGGTTPVSQMDCSQLDGVQDQLTKQHDKLNDEIETATRDLNGERTHLANLDALWTQAKHEQASAQASYDRLLDALPECRNPTGTKLGCGPNFRGPAAKAEAAWRDLRSADNVEAATRKNVEISNNTIDSKNALIKGDQTKLKGVEGAQLQVRTAQSRKHCP